MKHINILCVHKVEIYHVKQGQNFIFSAIGYNNGTDSKRVYTFQGYFKAEKNYSNNLKKRGIV